MTIFSAAAELLATGPQSLADLTAHVVAAGATRSRNPESTVRQAITSRGVQLADDRWANPIQLLEGRVLTTRGPGNGDHDLAMLHRAVRWAPLPLADGGMLKADPWFESPIGWPPFEEGELYGLRLNEGVLHVQHLDDVQHLDLRRVGRRLVALVGPLVGRRWCFGPSALSEDLTARLWSHLYDDPSLLRAAAPPFSECFHELNAAILAEHASLANRVEYWRPTLQLPAHLEWVAQSEAAQLGEDSHTFLNDLVTQALRDLNGASLGKLIALPGLSDLWRTGTSPAPT